MGKCNQARRVPKVDPTYKIGSFSGVEQDVSQGDNWLKCCRATGGSRGSVPFLHFDFVALFLVYHIFTKKSRSIFLNDIGYLRYRPPRKKIGMTKGYFGLSSLFLGNKGQSCISVYP
jgi:hypothetical protein